jgi:hypothetical protein
MAFLTSYRAEKVYFEKLRSNIDIAKSYIQRGATDEVMALLQNAVDADGAIMLCYRNLGEVWADLAAQLEKTQKALEDLKTALEEYHDDLNKKIDEINNYLIRLINALDERVTILENESKVKFAYLNYDSVEDIYSIEYNGETADFDTLSAALEYPHLLVLIDNENGNIYYPRSVSDVLIDFHADGVSGADYVDISVTMTDSDVVTVTEKTVVNYTFGAGFNVSNTNEVTPDLSVLQAKLTAGFGIEIDSSNEISVDTNDVQEKLIAGQNITLTPDATDPTKTVIDAAGGGGGNYPNVETLTQSYSLRAAQMPALASADFPCTGFRLELNQDNNPSMKDGVKNGVYFEGYYGHNSTKVTAADLPNIHNDAFVNIEVIDKLTFDFVNDSGHKYMYDSITGNLIGYYHNTSDGIYREKQATFPDKCIDFSGMINAGWLLSKITLNRYVCCTMNSVEYGSGITTLIDSTFVKELVDMNRYVTAKFMLNP